MTLNIAADRVPLALDDDGVARVGGSRVPIDTVICAFTDGATAEQIAEQFPSLRLSNIYSVIGYYLDHREEVDEYLAERASRSEEVRERIEAQRDLSSIRERLIQRSKRGA